MRSANQIARLDNKEIQNKNKRSQLLLDEGGPLNNMVRRITFSASYLRAPPKRKSHKAVQLMLDSPALSLYVALSMT